MRHNSHFNENSIYSVICQPICKIRKLWIDKINENVRDLFNSLSSLCTEKSEWKVLYHQQSGTSFKRLFALFKPHFAYLVIYFNVNTSWCTAGNEITTRQWDTSNRIECNDCEKKTIKRGQKSFNSEIVCKLYQYLFILFKMSIEM